MVSRSENPGMKPTRRGTPAEGWYVAAENDYRDLGGAPQPTRTTPVTVVIPVYNRVDLLRRTLAGLAGQDHPGGLLSVIVADDGSDEDVEAGIADLREYLDLSIVRRDHDGYGAGQARNLGARHASGEVLVFVDADCVPDPSLVERHVAWHELAPNIVVIGSRQHVDTSALDASELLGGAIRLRDRAFGQRDLPGAVLEPDDWRRLLYRRTIRLRRGNEAFRALVSSNFSIRRDRFLEVGGFDEDFVRWGGEDTELGWRLFEAGLFIVPEDRAVIYHQTQEDEGDAPDWRQRARRLNDGIIATKIPHRFYRQYRRWSIHETPKVSIVLSEVRPQQLRDVISRVQQQTMTDWEIVVPREEDDPIGTVMEDETRADPRIRFVTAAGGSGEVCLHRALGAARGQYVAVVSGAASVERRLLSRTLKPLEEHPRLGLVTTGYLVWDGEEEYRYLREVDLEAVDRHWGRHGLPVFHLARRREWAKALRVTATVGEAFELLRSTARDAHVADALIGLPGERPERAVDVEFPMAFGDRTLLRADLDRAGGRLTKLRLVARAAIAHVRREPFRTLGDDEQPLARSTSERAGGPAGPAETVHTRYIGWVGHDNLGDEALLASIRQLLPWADITTKGRVRQLLLLGGGTLINRGYLAQLVEHDSPRIERAVFGAGVANPEYWGAPREDPQEWVDFLTTCGFVGVRGPISAEILRSWGYEGPLEIIGDPALALRPPDDRGDRREDLVVVNIADTRGLLWGEDDEAVYESVSDLVKRLVADGREVAVLSCHPRDDHPGYEILRRAGAADARYVAGYRSVEDALRLLATAGVVVGERLHALVLAAACGTPFVGLEYRPKVRDFASSVGMERFTVRTDAVTGELLTEMVADLESGRDEVVRTLAASVERYRDRLERAGREVRELIR
jgi:GT2 family glycosyltransferase/polysaccharide pyruvyl transferase WcaK-like protein